MVEKIESQGLRLRALKQALGDLRPVYQLALAGRRWWQMWRGAAPETDRASFAAFSVDAS